MPIVRLLVALALLPFVASAPALADKRVALVIGNAAYAHAGALLNPANDATDIAKSLEKHGFRVILGVDLEKQALDGKVREFARALAEADSAIFFYAGHGLQVGGKNYIVPVDAKLGHERDLDFEAVPIDFILRQMELGREAKTNIVFLDACRDNPLARNLARSMGTRSTSVGQGLAQVEAGVGTFISFSTQPGNVALDGKGRNSPFTEALTRHIGKGGRNLNAIMIDVRKDVLAATQGKQVPWDHSALTGDFYFDTAALDQGVPKSPSEVTAPDTGAMAARIKKLEQELAERADSEAKARLEDLKEKSESIDRQNREDWQRIFDLRRTSMREQDNSRRNQLEDEARRLQMTITRRGAERQKLVERIAEMETKLGIAKPEAAPTP